LLGRIYSAAHLVNPERPNLFDTDSVWSPGASSYNTPRLEGRKHSTLEVAQTIVTVGVDPFREVDVLSLEKLRAEALRERFDELHSDQVVRDSVYCPEGKRQA
jgi:hypothetical protein